MFWKAGQNAMRRAAWSLPTAAGVSWVIAEKNTCALTEERQDSSINLLRRVDKFLQERARAIDPRVATVYDRKPAQTDVVRIALTGGPCAGKSSGLDAIVKAGTAEGFDVYTAPETATLIFNSGMHFPSDPEAVFTFQCGLARMQLQMERSLTAMAAATGRPSIIVFDRGLLDAKGYMSLRDWERMLTCIGGGDNADNKTGVSENYLLARYDGVIHMVTAADGAEKFYKWGKTTDDSGATVIRNETPAMARELDRKMQDAWFGHTMHVIVPNRGSFKEKITQVSSTVLNIAKNKHPAGMK
eukprot:gnl/MRDRNA2_/MRDRNA2_160208_c0_seq1.p1 gnl/MRDRNA2_/MRDRNA2_160208_c0~~gnl/MRDRNA2_/MRDRNA2_160208_c0_seq1.p1  ORF type:complete len:300 (+),score=58.61 gnl/MRDRNA2_/MRDRNA2_160208_c0_seq1:44-943(+)